MGADQSLELLPQKAWRVGACKAALLRGHFERHGLPAALRTRKRAAAARVFQALIDPHWVNPAWAERYLGINAAAASWPSVATLQRACGWPGDAGERRVRRALRLLEREGLIVAVHGSKGGRALATTYFCPDAAALLMRVDDWRGPAEVSPFMAREAGSVPLSRPEVSPFSAAKCPPNPIPENPLRQSDPDARVREDPDHIGPSVQAMLDSIEADRIARELAA